MKTVKICPKTIIYGIESKISIPNIENLLRSFTRCGTILKVHFSGADVLKEYFELEKHRGRWENGRKINGIEYKILGIKEGG